MTPNVALLSTRLLYALPLLGLFFIPIALAQTTLDTIFQKHVIRIGLINDRHHYHLTAEGPVGFDYNYALGFADYLNVSLEVVPFYSEISLRNALINKHIDLAAPRFRFSAMTDSITNGPLLFSTQLATVQMGNDDINCTNVDEPPGVVLPSIEETIAGTQPSGTWQTSTTPDSVSLLNQLTAQNNSCTILPEIWLSALSRDFPAMRTRVLPDTSVNKQWAARNEDIALLSSLFEYTHLSRTNGSLEVLMAQMLQPPRTALESVALENIDTRILVETFYTKFAALKDELLRVDSALNWHYIAAIDYLLNDWQAAQISSVKENINPDARLAQISRRLDKLQLELPARIKGADRTWFIIAAYYLGIEHIKDARQLTEKAGGNPDLWIDVKHQLPRLQTEYAETHYGFADGQQAVIFVDQVRYVAESIATLLKAT